MSFFYRFRSVDALLGEHHELEKQEIYFAPPEQLNDPMEGYKDLFWRGDEIVWRNLIRHYLLCLMQTIAVAMISGKDYRSIITRGFVFTTRLSLPTDTFKDIYQRVCATFFSIHNLDALPILFASCHHSIRRDEFEFYLRGLHPMAFSAVVKVFREEKLIPPADTVTPVPEFAEEDVVKNLTKVLSTIKDSEGTIKPEAFRALFSATEHVYQQMDLARYLGASNELARSWHSIYYSFPQHYTDSLGDLIYFDWYAACFVADPTHAAMWGNYGDAHKGVCLKFRADEQIAQQPVLKMRGINGWRASSKGSSPIYGEVTLRFQKMIYVDKMVEIDFFRSIGRVSVGALKSEWYSDQNGRVSDCAEHVFAKTSEWHQRYWAAFNEMTTTKLQYWRHENEYRLILVSALGLFQETKDRKLTYSFTDLEGITFGIRTSLEDKTRIVNIVAEKCKEENRRSFEFSQAIYNAQSGKIEARPLDLLQFKVS